MGVKTRSTLIVSFLVFLLTQLPAAVSAQPSYSMDDSTGGEPDSGSTYAWYLLRRSQTGTTGSVRVASSGGTATGGSTCGSGVDYLSFSGVYSFSATESQKGVRVELCGDTRRESNETIVATLSSPTGGTISDSQAVMTITDNDTPRVRVGDLTRNEGNSGQTTFAVPVTLSKSIDQPVTVTYTIDQLSPNTATEGTACSGTTDFIGNGTGTRTLTYLANTTTLSQTVNVPVCGDTTSEAAETFTVVLWEATNGVIDDNYGNVTISNDDAAQLPVLSIGDISWAEPDNSRGAGSVAVALVPLRLSSASTSGATINFTCSGGTATESTRTGACSTGSDYWCYDGIVPFQPGSTSKAIQVSICWDRVREGNETVQIRLSNPVGLTAPDTTGTLTITDND